MNSKNILTVIGVLNILQGIGFFIGAETLTVQSFPAELLEGGGLVVGNAVLCIGLCQLLLLLLV